MYFCLVLWDSVASPNKWPSDPEQVTLDVLLNLMFIPLLPGFQLVAAAIEEQTIQSLKPGVPDLNGRFSQNWNFTHFLLTTWSMEGVDIS